MYKISFSVRNKKWLEDPRLRWKAGLEVAGLQFRQRLQRQNYPPPPPMSTYVRTGLTASKAGFKIEMPGRRLIMWFGSTSYLPALLMGSEHWVGWTPWKKKEEIIDYMSKGFKKGVVEYKE